MLINFIYYRLPAVVSRKLDKLLLKKSLTKIWPLTLYIMIKNRLKTTNTRLYNAQAKITLDKIMSVEAFGKTVREPL